MHLIKHVVHNSSQCVSKLNWGGQHGYFCYKHCPVLENEFICCASRLENNVLYSMLPATCLTEAKRPHKVLFVCPLLMNSPLLSYNVSLHLTFAVLIQYLTTGLRHRSLYNTCNLIWLILALIRSERVRLVWHRIILLKVRIKISSCSLLDTS